ncbi:hypothetical protein CesoFtcFv8_024056 [Champsocephalus esox]|uniref:Starch-binding domain-containing protein 1 n=1 Tax=Champsocephalus esox TaxID=159716 RepID=A0AAN8B5W3_9TELE|nr:hypothetical protein CesoFtcFv8_024056 [Champsocephalus esox]
MPLKNGNTVGVERRMDLASLFCMIGRHGPAVALAMIAIVSVLAGFVIYRTVRGKKRKAADGDGKSPGEERDAAGVQEQSPEEARSCVQSTDASDEVLSDMKEDVCLIQSDLKVRHRRSAENTSSPYPHLNTSDDAEEVAVVWDSYQVSEAYAEEASKSQQSGTYKEAELVLEDAVDRQDVLEELHYNESCLNKTETIKDENNEEEKKVLKSEGQEDEGLSTDEDVSDKQTREETDNLLCAFINPLCFEQTRHMSENSDEDKDNKTTNDVEDSEEPIIHIEDVPVPCVCYDNEEFEEEEPESIDCNSYSADNNFSPDEEHGCEEAEEECLKDEGHDDSLSDQQSDQQIIPEDTTGAASVMTEDNKPPICQIRLPSFEQFEMRDNDPSLVGSAGVEIEISSMAVSPDAGNDFDVIFEHTVLPMMDCYLKSDGQMEAQNILFVDDAAISSIEDDTAGMVFQPFPSHHSQQPHSEQTSWTDYESLAANTDMFGHEITESYHKAIDQFAAEIANSVTSFVEELDKQSDVKVVEVKEQKAGVSVEKKEETKAEKEKEEDYEKTEISIMEATMDHNEWIMDGNYQTLPWMNLSALSIPQDLTKTNELPTEESQNSSASTDTTCVDPTEIPPSTDVQQTSTLSLVDNNTENNKKVVAVKPMPQNVNVTFRVHYITQSPNQMVAVTGNQQEIGNWKEFIPLERAKDGHWATVVSLPAESHVEWKFVVVDKGEVCRWEEGGNRHLDAGYGDDLLVHQRWGLF